jgi:SOS-response transcriptional repressor LexA
MQDVTHSPDICVGSRIKEIRLAKGLTQKEFADSLGIVQGFLSSLERGKKVPSDTLLIALCHLYEINPEWMQCGTGKMLKSAPREKVPNSLVVTRTPLLRHISKEFPNEVTDEDVFDYVSLPHVPEGCYALITYGDFMAPTIRDGDLVIFRPGGEVLNRDIVLVRNRWEEVIIRRYRLKEDELYFAPDNPSYSPFRPDPNTRIVGKVIDVWRKMRL